MDTSNKFCQVSTCCGFVGLENGCYITAIIQIITGAIAMIYKSYLAATVRSHIIWDNDPNWELYNMTVASAIGSAVHVIFGCVLYTGVQNNHTKRVLSWIWFMVVALTISLIFLIRIVVQSIEAGANAGDISNKCNFSVIIMVFEIYLVVVVYSFYKMIKSENSLTEHQ